ncbi:MAG: hypothetical protein ACOCWQ_06255 [Nanoarchaeota archaeon]
MTGDIRDSKQFKNIGIDKDLVANVGAEEQPHQPVQKPLEPVPGDIDVEAISQEILQKASAQTHQQVVDLASQMEKFAQEIRTRLDKLEGQVRNMLQRENQADLGVQEPQKTLEDAPEENKQPPKEMQQDEDYSPDDVCVEKMFNYSNTHGQNTPKPVR